MKRIAALVALVIFVIGMAHLIEVTARPETGRHGRTVGADGHGH